MAGGMSRIKHLVVVMMENRSFDSFLGWLYGPLNAPSQVKGGRAGDPEFFGLEPGSYWNPANAGYFQGDPPEPVFATEGTSGSSPYTVPDPDPEESFDHINFQLLGPRIPKSARSPSMLGFLVDYGTTGSTNPATIMETFSSGQLPVLSGLARNYAVCDAWFASAPCETWPNRAFVHTGTANGGHHNVPNNPFDFDIPTIFNVLEANGSTWAVYNPGPFISLTRLQFPHLYDLQLDSHFLSITDFAARRKPAHCLPTRSSSRRSCHFPRRSDQHPPTTSAWASSSCSKLQCAGRRQKLGGDAPGDHLRRAGGCSDQCRLRGAVLPTRPATPARRVSISIASRRSRAAGSGFAVDPGEIVFRSSSDVPFDHSRSWRPFATGWKFPRASCSPAGQRGARPRGWGAEPGIGPQGQAGDLLWHCLPLLATLTCMGPTSFSLT